MNMMVGMLGLYFWDNTLTIETEDVPDEFWDGGSVLVVPIDRLAIEIGGEDEGDREKEIENLTKLIDRLVAARDGLQIK
jgi:hypothetical protein